MIAIVINALGGGGAERSMIQVANSLNNSGMQTSLIVVNKGGFDLIKPEVRTFELERNPDSNIIELIRVIRVFRRILNEIAPNKIVLNCDLPELLGCFAPNSSRIYVVEHANPSWRTRKLLGYLVRKLEYFRRVNWVKVSNHLQITYCPSAIAVTIANPIPSVLFPQITRQALCPIRRLVFIGRLEEIQKRPSVVLKVSEKLDLPCLIVGEGADLAMLQDFARATKVEVEFKSFLENPWTEITEGDLLIVPSLYEGDGLVVVEGIIRQVPIIVSKIKDFERFSLSPINYFQSLDDLIEKIMTHQNNCSVFAVSPEVSRNMMENRSIQRISDDWKNLLS